MAHEIANDERRRTLQRLLDRVARSEELASQTSELLAMTQDLIDEARLAVLTERLTAEAQEEE